MTFTHKIVHANDRDEIWVQNKSNNTINTDSNDPVTAKAVVEYVEKTIPSNIQMWIGEQCFRSNPSAPENAAKLADLIPDCYRVVVFQHIVSVIVSQVPFHPGSLPPN
jgi:hypothetical protein